MAKTATATKTKLVPLNDRIVIKPVVQEEVLAVGPGRVDDTGKRIAMDVQVGDRVLYAKYTGQEVKIDQEEYIVISEQDVLAKVQV